jgi:quercetin dioxygenase-like cupin family protein
MTAQLEPNFTLTDNQPACVQIEFIKNNFSDTEDDRGRALLFEQVNKPATFIEVINTLSGKIRGNHVHQECDEVINVVSGKLDLYLLCDCVDRHVFKHAIAKGDTAIIPKGTPHALQALEETDIVVSFEKDPRKDRDRVQILSFEKC